MEQSICYSIICIQKGDKNALLETINKFMPLINKLSKKMIYEEAKTDLIIFLIQMLRSIDLSKFKDHPEGSLVSYIHVALKNKSIDCFKKNYLYGNGKVYLDIDITEIKDVNDIDITSKLFVDELLNIGILTQRQKIILKQYYLYGYSDVEIAELFNVSRQAIHKARVHGLNIIKEYITSNSLQ